MPMLSPAPESLERGANPHLRWSPGQRGGLDSGGAGEAEACRRVTGP
jgi:hypothetical protein